VASGAVAGVAALPVIAEVAAPPAGELGEPDVSLLVQPAVRIAAAATETVIVLILVFICGRFLFGVGWSLAVVRCAGMPRGRIDALWMRRGRARLSGCG
jgi:hypothetical protein